jgi:Domain of unknown function (DUF1772)
MIGPLATAVVLSAVLFTTWALYITLVEHPARLESGPAAGRAQFGPSYRRAAPWQASFASVALLGGGALGVLTARWTWWLGAVAIGAAIPLTLFVIVPTNRRLLAAGTLTDAEATGLLRRWGRWHAVRTALGGVGLLAFLASLGPR